jgi:hypothetical protein
LASPIIWTSTCQPHQYRPIDEPLLPDLIPGSSQPNASYVQSTFHQWVTQCYLPPGTVAPGDYYVQVLSTAAMGNPSQPTGASTHGYNRFSIRAGFVSNSFADFTASSATNVQVFAVNRLPVFVNVQPGQQSEFYLAHIPSSSGGHNLRLEFFDLGDVGPGTLTMQVVPPSDWASQVSCTMQRDTDTSAQSYSDCTLRNISQQGYNGRLITALINIPPGYSCDDADPQGCWFKIKMTYSSTSTPFDTTTWSASVDGEPVRLVPNSS